MKKAILVMVICLCIILSGCQQSCDHEYATKINDDEIIYSCEKCDHSYTARRLGHKHCYGEPIVTQSASCNKDGEQLITCTICDHSETEQIPGGHDWADATCLSPQYCSYCGITSGDALGHTTNNGTCYRCGEEFSITDDCELRFKNSLPCTITTYYSTGTLWSKVKITQTSYEFESYGDTVDLILDVRMTILDVYEDYGGCMVVLYDAAGNNIGERYLVDENLYDGMIFSDTANFYYLDPGTYTVEFVPFW